MKNNQETYLNLVVETASKIATEHAIALHEKLKDDDKKREKDKQLRNTKLLLRNYRDFKEYVNHVEGNVKDKNSLPNEEATIKDLLVRGEDIVKTIKQSTQRTIMMVTYIDQALSAFKYICENDINKSAIRQYGILNLRFVEGKTIEAISEEYDINVRNVYKAIDVAAERLSVILFGVYGLNFS
jgi:hypothetical protein